MNTNKLIRWFQYNDWLPLTRNGVKKTFNGWKNVIMPYSYCIVVKWICAPRLFAYLNFQIYIFIKYSKEGTIVVYIILVSIRLEIGSGSDPPVKLIRVKTGQLIRRIWFSNVSNRRLYTTFLLNDRMPFFSPSDKYWSHKLGNHFWIITNRN